MKQFGTFESQVAEILEEGKFEDVMAFAKRATGSSAFDTTGIIDNKYDSKKNYYPNIRRGGKTFWKNIKLDDANSALIDYIKRLQSSPQPSITTKNEVSSDYVQTSQDEFVKFLKAENTPALVKGLPEYQDAISALNMNDANYEITDIENDLFAFQTAVNNLLSTGITLAEKAEIDQYRIQYKDKHDKWFKVFEKTSGSLVVDQPQEMLGAFLKKSDGKIYRNKWGVFLETVQNGIVGAGQRSYGMGTNTMSLITGKGYSGKRKYWSEYDITDREAIDPAIIKKFHNDVMVPLFLTKPNDYLIYATPEQWEEISQGSKAFKGAAGVAGFLGKQFMSAGRNRPKVQL